MNLLKNSNYKTAGLILFLLFMGLLACKKDYIDYAKLKQDEINAREQYLADSFQTVQLTEDEVTYTALIIDNDTIKPTSTGLYYIPEVEGTGDKPIYGRTVEMKYTGWFLNGEVFDSSDDFEFYYTSSGSVIPGWIEALGYMQVGSKAKLIIPSGLAYGQYGYGDVPSYTTLVFEVELINAQ